MIDCLQGTTLQLRLIPGFVERISESFTAARTLDFREVVNHVKERHPQSKLFAVGYSMGAGARPTPGRHNQLTRRSTNRANADLNVHAYCLGMNEMVQNSSWEWCILIPLRAFLPCPGPQGT